MTPAFTIYTGNEIVADMHLHPTSDVRLYEPVPSEYHLGGAHVFNAASIAAHIREDDNLDGQVAILGTVSKDVFGEHFMANCDRLGIDTQHVVRVDASTLIAVVTHGEHNNSFYFPNAQANAMLAVTPDALPFMKEEDHKMLVMQGVCSSMQPSGALWLQYARSEFKDDLIIYDVNARPSLITNLKRHQKLVDKWAEVAAIVKISDADIEALYPGKSFAQVGERFLDLGTKMVVETRGHKSVRVMSAAGAQEFSTPQLTGIRNTVGAGDNFMAGLTLSFAKIDLFKREDLSKSGRADVWYHVESGLNSAREHLLRQNPGAAPQP